ncbi:Lrp/AsnC family transcriptional regulator [Shewanella xiamenensis]|jgi:Lrp/AsnC family leucine-responsive transcriptional regulator|uniref:Lrp/AsnC family transcriptional regulator n=1 Tax=Shewanella xiamenensis TaxID=332186 RepID=A0ABT6UCG5_9GAMM|nr:MULTISPECIES: Lrp/AsnC family transcriptional regulator [Shewanella]PZP28807.1 MAG: Lrp/AsnC family transcriptional regulator [Shewanella oneidensis]ASF16758.1 Lrp/AsnC family transcriptional regulator [Shewanella sp. FDAARGOS_354]MBW0279873.1 AsnC family transcriptional regulator [Shewanella xiamenensis]MCH7421883.1 Lrp/AsnC family transcriptional regulator [Shewanella sp. MM_2022_3]MCL1070801.1 Lrp/AsnC family transcriptional regulator [Shewanella xiamenensis]
MTETHPYKLDQLDLTILRLLQTHGRLSNLELATKVGLSPSPCSRRVKALEEAGYIADYVTRLSADKFNLHLTAYIHVRMEKHTPAILNQFEANILGYEEVQECALITGSEADYQLKVLVQDMAHFRTFLLDKLTTNVHIAGVHSSFVLKKVKEHTAIPLSHITIEP